MTFSVETRASSVSRSGTVDTTAQVSQEPAEPSELTLREGADPSALAKLLTTSDDMALLFALQILSRDAQIDIAKADAVANKEEMEDLFFKIQEAIKQIHEAAKSKGFFSSLFNQFGVLGKVAVLVAAVASMAASGGVSVLAVAALAGTLMSTCSTQLAKLVGGSELAEKIFRYGGAGVSLAAGGIGAIQALTGGAGAVGTAVAPAVKEIGRQVAQGASYVASGATAAQAGTGYARDEYAAQELDARGEERHLRADRAFAFTQQDALLEFMMEVQKSFTNANRTLTQAIDQQSQSTLRLATIGARA